MFIELYMAITLNKTVVPQQPIKKTIVPNKQVAQVKPTPKKIISSSGWVKKPIVEPEEEYKSLPLKYFKKNNTNVIASNMDMLPSDCDFWKPEMGEDKKTKIGACVKLNDNQVLLNTNESKDLPTIQQQLDHEFSHKIIRDKKLEKEAIDIFGSEENMANWYEYLAAYPKEATRVDPVASNWLKKNIKF